MSGLFGRLRKPAQPPREDVLYVHLRDDGGIFTVKGSGEQGLVSEAELLAEVGRIAAREGLILYSRDHPDRDPPARVTQLFQSIVDLRPAFKLVDTPHRDAVPTGGTTTLMAAAHTGQMDLVKDLLRRDAPLDAHDDVGYTALMYAANAGQGDIVTKLLAAGADPNRVDRDGSTPLMFAAQHGFAEIVDALLAGGAKKSLKGKRGFTAFDFARQNGHRDLFARLDPHVTFTDAD